jgi:hypothetical protein
MSTLSALRAQVRRRGPTRVVALLWLVLFPLLGVRDAFGLHECMHHRAAAAETHPAAAHGYAHDGHAHHGAAPAGAGVPEDADTHESHHDLCTCVGSCQVGYGDSAPPTSAFAARVTRAARAGAPAPDATRLPGQPAFLLPYALAPPTLG